MKTVSERGLVCWSFTFNKMEIY